MDRFIEQIQDQFKVVASRGLQIITVRHYQEDRLESLIKGKIVMLEERIRQTVQMVVKDAPTMKWKNEGMKE